MEYIPGNYLIKHQITKPGQQFFIFLWLELFNRFTIDTYRFRAMNGKSILIEMIEVLEYVNKGIWDISNVVHVCAETLSLIKSDKVLQKEKYLEGLQKSIDELKNKPGSQDNQTRCKILLYNIVNDLKQKYVNEIIKGLKYSLLKENLDDIEWYTKSLATELINSGYDREFLYDSCRNFFFSDDTKTFTFKLNKFTQYLLKGHSAFTVYLKIYPNKIDAYPQRIMDYEFEKNLSISSENPKIVDYINTGDRRLFAVSTVDAVDPYSAAIIARSKLGSVLDIMQYGYQNNNFRSEDQCLVYDNDNETYIPCNSLPGLVGYFKNSGEWLSTIESQLTKIIKNNDIKQSAKEKLKGALRYFRLSKEAINIEHQFLNLWIALEHLIRTGARHKSIIEPITNFVPKSLALNYISRLIRDVTDNITRCRVIIPEPIRAYIDKNAREKFILVVRDQALFDMLANADNINPLLKHRLEELRDLLKDSKSIREGMEKNHTDINLHLARMYRVRNLIVHSAAHDLTITGITANLLFYVNDIINKLLYEMSCFDSFKDLWEVYIKYQFTYDQFVTYLKKDHKNEIRTNQIIKPQTLLWPT